MEDISIETVLGGHSSENNDFYLEHVEFEVACEISKWGSQWAVRHIGLEERAAHKRLAER